MSIHSDAHRNLSVHGNSLSEDLPPYPITYNSWGEPSTSPLYKYQVPTKTTEEQDPEGIWIFVHEGVEVAVADPNYMGVTNGATPATNKNGVNAFAGLYIEMQDRTQDNLNILRRVRKHHVTQLYRTGNAVTAYVWLTDGGKDGLIESKGTGEFRTIGLCTGNYPTRSDGWHYSPNKPTDLVAKNNNALSKPVGTPFNAIHFTWQTNIDNNDNKKLGNITFNSGDNTRLQYTWGTSWQYYTAYAVGQFQQRSAILGGVILLRDYNNFSFDRYLNELRIPDKLEIDKVRGRA